MPEPNLTHTPILTTQDNSFVQIQHCGKPSLSKKWITEQFGCVPKSTTENLLSKDLLFFFVRLLCFQAITSKIYITDLEKQSH